MKLEGSHDVPAPRQKVWDAFLDPRQLKKATRGCEKLEPLGGDAFKATLKVGVAAVKGTFEGKVRLSEQKPIESYRLAAEGSGGPGFVKADTLITLSRIERASRAELTRLQTRRLREQVRHAAAASPFYRRKFRAAGVRPERVRTLADLRALPFTTKDELKDNQAAKPLWGDLLAVPFEDVLRVHMTSATTGRPLAVLDTAADWHGFYHSYARSLHAFGVRRADMVMAAFSYGPWIGYWSG